MGEDSWEKIGQTECPGCGMHVEVFFSSRQWRIKIKSTYSKTKHIVLPGIENRDPYIPDGVEMATPQPPPPFLRNKD